MLEKGSLGAVVKLLPCDHEVTGSSPGNSLLQKCRERLRTKDPSGRTLPLTLRKRELRALGLPFFNLWGFYIHPFISTLISMIIFPPKNSPQLMAYTFPLS